MKRFMKKLIAFAAAAAAVMMLVPMDVKASGVPDMSMDGKAEKATTLFEQRDSTGKPTGRYFWSHGLFNTEAPSSSVKTVTITVKALGSASDSSAVLDIYAYTNSRTADEWIDLYRYEGMKNGETKQFTINVDDLIYLNTVDLISDVNDFQYEISAVSSGFSETAELVEPAAGTLYRLYNPNSSEHFYTGSTAERDSLTAVGWKDEGTAWTSPEEGSPVYRLYNPNAGDHFYTVSAGEKDSLVAAGWRYEGIGWNSDTNNTVPVYREYNPNAKTGSHNYTASKAEHDHLVSLGWKDEGIAWYGA